MFDVLRTGSWLMRPGDITVYCEEPIITEGFPREDIPDLTERIRATIAARVDEHRRSQGVRNG